MNDTKLINWLEKQPGVGLISDDNGHWAVSGTGIQNVPTGAEPQDIETTFIVFKSEWRDNIRQAILAAIKEF